MAKANYTRVDRAIVEVLTPIMRITLSRKVQPKDVFEKVNNAGNKKKKNMKLTEGQMNQIEEASKSRTYKHLNITLLYSLLRNLCGNVKPTNGWVNLPRDKDISLYDDIERIRLFDQNYRGQSTTTEMSDDEFQDVWSQLESICRRRSKNNEYVVKLEDIKRAPIDDSLPCKIAAEKVDIKKWQKENSKFFKTKASEYIRQKIGDCRFLTIAGAIGSGKTFLARNLALYYHTFGWLVISVRFIEELIKLINTNSNVKQFYLFDDPLGTDMFKLSEYSALSQRETVEVMKICLESTNIKIVFTCRTNILMQRKYIFPINENVEYIDRGNIALSPDEKMGILKEYTDLKFSVVEQNIVLNTMLRFPLLCSRIDQSKSQEDTVQMFKSTILFEEEIDKLREDSRKQFCALSILLIYDGELHEKEFLEDDDERMFQSVCSCCLAEKFSKRQLVETLNAAVGNYVEKEGNVFRFQHHVIMEAVGVVFGRRYPLEMIRYCPMRILRKRIHLENSPVSFQPGVRLKREMIDSLITRLLDDIRKGLLIDVVLCPFLREDHFIQLFLEKIKSFSDEEIYFLFAKQHTQCTSLSSEEYKIIQKLDENLVEYMYTLKTHATAHAKCNSNFDISFILNLVVKICHTLKEINEKDCGEHLPLTKHVFCGVKNVEQFYREVRCIMFDILTILNKFSYNSYISEVDNSFISEVMMHFTEHFPMGEKSLNFVEAMSNLYADITDFFRYIPVNREKLSDRIDTIYTSDVNFLDIHRLLSPSIQHQKHLRSRLTLFNDTDSLMDQFRIDLAILAPKNTAMFYFAAFDHNEIFCQIFNKIVSVKKGKELKNIGLFSATCICGSVRNARMILDNFGFVREEWIFKNNCVSPLHIASAFLHTEIIHTILRLKLYKSDVNREDSMKRLPLHYALRSLAGAVSPAVEKKGRETVQILIDQETDFDKKDAFGFTTMHYACMVCSKSIFDIIVAWKGIQVNVRDYLGRSPLFVAVEHSNIYAVKSLLSQPVIDVDMCNIYEHTPLHRASAYGHLKIVVHLLQKRPTINRKDWKGRTSLHLASAGGHQHVVKILIEHEADIDIKDCNGDTPIFHSVYQGHGSITQILLENGADITQRNSVGESLLHVSSRTGNKLIVEMLVRKMQNFDITREQDNYTPLMLAAANGQTDIMNVLIENAAKLNFSTPEGITPLLVAIQNRQTLAVDLLLAKKVYIAEKEEGMFKPIIFCAIDGNVEILQALLNNGACINVRDADGRTALWYASKYGRVEIVNKLLNKNADANLCDEKSYSPIFIASTHGHETVCRVLRDVCDTEHFQLERFRSLLAATYFGHLNVVDVFFEKRTDDRYISSILMAALSGHTRILGCLIEKYKDSDFLDLEMRKAVLLAIRNGNLHCVQFLFECGVRADVITEHFRQRSKMYEGGKMKRFSIDQETQKYTALHVAAKYNQSQITHFILKNGGDVNISTPNGESPLFIAAERGRKEVMKVLLEHSANVNHANDQGITPLMVASKKGFVHIVSMLLQKNANINGISIVGKSALWYAVKRGKADIVSILLHSVKDIKISENDIVNLFQISLIDCNVKITNLLFCFARKYLPNLSAECEKIKPFLFRLQTKVTKRQAIQRHLRLRWLVRGKFKYLLWTRYVHANWRKTTIFKKQTREVEITVCKSDCSLDFYRKINFPSKPYQIHSGKIEILKQQKSGISSRKIQQLFRMQRRYLARNLSLYKVLHKREKMNKKILPTTEVVTASIKGDVDRVNALIQNNTNLNICSCNRRSPVNFACVFGYCDVVRILLKNNPNIILCPEQHISPLIIAAMNGNYEITCCILSLLDKLAMKEKKNYINKRTLKGRTALWYAAERGESDITIELIKHRANVNLSDNSGKTPLYIASRNGHFNVLNCLFKSGANDFNESMIAASTFGHCSIVSFLINRAGVDMTAKNSKGYTALMAASQNGNVRIVELLLKKINQLMTFTSDEKQKQICLVKKNSFFKEAEKHVSTITDASNNSLPVFTDMKNSLWIAAYEGRYEVVRIFLDIDVKFSYSKFHVTPPLHISVARGFEDIARLLIQHGALVNKCDKNGFTPLFIASASGNNVLVREFVRLCDKGKEHYIDQARSLIIAAEQGFVDVVETLVNNGVDINIQTVDGTTALMYATRNHHYNVAMYLINKTANVDKKQKDGKTAVWIASAVDSLKILELLLSRNADVNLPDNKENSPLHVAIANNHFKAMQLLLRFGADANVCNIYGKTPHQMAFPRKRLIRFLSYHNCKQLYHFEDLYLKTTPQREDLDRKTTEQKRKLLENNINTVNIDKQRRHFANNSILLSNYALMPLPMARDGNCFFNALLVQMDSASKSVDIIRDAVCNHLAENFKHYSKFITYQQHEKLAEVYSEQVRKLRGSSMWNERLADCMPLAAANVFQRPVRIFSAFDGNIQIIEPDLSHSTGSFFNLRHDLTPGGEHYDALIHV